MASYPTVAPGMVFPNKSRDPRYLGLEEMEARVPYAGRARSAAESLIPDMGGAYEGMPQSLMDRIGMVSEARGAEPRFRQEMAGVRSKTRGILGGGRSFAARMGASRAEIPGVRREAGRTFAEGAGNAAAKFAETKHMGTVQAAGMMQPLAAEEMRRREGLERSRGRLAGSVWGQPNRPGYSFSRTGR